MNIKIPVSEAIKRIERRIKDIREANEYNKKIEEDYDRALAEHKVQVIKYVKRNLSVSNGSITKRWQEGSLEVSMTINSDIYPLPKMKDRKTVPSGSLSELERILSLLKVTTSETVNLTSIKGLSEII